MKTLIALLLISVAASAQLPSSGSVPGTGTGVGVGAVNPTATCAGPATSCAITITSLNLTVFDSALLQCKTATGGDVAITSAPTSGGPPLTTVTPNYSSASNITCKVNSNGGAGAAGATGATGATGTAGAAGTNGTNGAISQIQENGTNKTVEPKLNLKSGTNATVTCVDNAGLSTDCTIASTGGSAISSTCAIVITGAAVTLDQNTCTNGATSGTATATGSAPFVNFPLTGNNVAATTLSIANWTQGPHSVRYTNGGSTVTTWTSPASFSPTPSVYPAVGQSVEVTGYYDTTTFFLFVSPNTAGIGYAALTTAPTCNPGVLPPTGTILIWGDSTDLTVHSFDTACVQYTYVKGVANVADSKVVLNVTKAGVQNRAQLGFSDLTGAATNAQLPGGNAYATVDDNGTAKTQRPIVNLISGTNATVSCADNAGATRTDCTISATAGSATPVFPINPQTSTYQLVAADFTNFRTIAVASGTFTITGVASGSQPAGGTGVYIINYGSGVVTFARSGQNINGAAANLTIAAGSASAPNGMLILSNGTDYIAQPLIGSATGGSGTVTSVIVTVPPQFGTSGCTITTSGTCVISFPALPNAFAMDVNAPYIQNGAIRRTAYMISSGSAAGAMTQVGAGSNPTGSGGAYSAPTATTPGASILTVANGSGVGWIEPTNTHRTGRTHGMRLNCIQWNSVITALREIDCGLTSTTLANSLAADVPGSFSMAYIVFSTTGTYTGVTDTTHYMFCTVNGTTQTCTSTGVTAVAATPHKFEVFEDIPNSQWCGSVDGTQVCSASNNPASGTALAFVSGSFGISAASGNYILALMFIVEDWY